VTGYYRTFFDPQGFMTPGMIEERSETWGKPISILGFLAS
jgi:hypothetical protein